MTQEKMKTKIYKLFGNSEVYGIKSLPTGSNGGTFFIKPHFVFHLFLLETQNILEKNGKTKKVENIIRKCKSDL